MVAIQLPETPVIIAGGLGGPSVMFLVTPMRNGLTLGALNPQLGAAALYRQVFSGGFARGWTGGIYPAIAACPQFLCLGPAYHVYSSFAGVAGGVVLASATESALVYGAETANAQLAASAGNPNLFKSIHPSWKPFGPGLGIHIFRNAIATAGLRMFCTPWATLIEKASGKKNGLTQLGGDFMGNVTAACISAPVHQLYGFVVTTPELRTLSASEKQARMIKFLKDSYLVTENGSTRLSSLVPRDLFMRSMYVAVAYTMYSTLERSIVQFWNR